MGFIRSGILATDYMTVWRNDPLVSGKIEVRFRRSCLPARIMVLQVTPVLLVNGIY